MSKADEAYDDKHYTKQIDCPEHKGQHEAKLYQFPHKYAGIWECPEGLSDSCEHEEIRRDSATVDTMRNGEHDQYETPVLVCEACEVTVGNDEPDFDDRSDDE